MANEDHTHIALPKLYGAPAYARPQAQPVARAERPFDPDELPLESQRSEDDRALAQALAEQPWQSASGQDGATSREGSPMLRGRPFRLGSITRLIRGDKASNGT